MRITCPACHASYDVPDAMLGVGRSVRCVRCLREWQPQPAAAPPDVDAPMESAAEAEAFDFPEPDRPRFTAADLETSPAPRLPEHAWRDVLLAQCDGRAAPPGRRDGWIGWLASLVLLAALAWAAIVFRAPVQHAWPPSTRLYAALGLGHAQPEPAPK